MQIAFACGGVYMSLRTQVKSERAVLHPKRALEMDICVVLGLQLQAMG